MENHIEAPSPTVAEKFQSWAILELMGHRKLAGYVQETEIAAGKFLRIDVPNAEGKNVTQFYAPASVYCITPTTEDICRQWAHNNNPQPISRYELAAPKADLVDVEDVEP